MSDEGVRVGVDIGGTFTDLVTVHDGVVRVTKTPSTPDAPERGVVNGLERSRDGERTENGDGENRDDDNRDVDAEGGDDDNGDVDAEGGDDDNGDVDAEGGADDNGDVDAEGGADEGGGGFRLADVSFLGHGTTVATNAVLEGRWADTALVTTEGFRDVLEIGRQARPDIYDFDAEKPTPIVPRDRRFEVPERLDERGEVRRELDEERVRELADRIAEEGVDSVAVSLLFAFENDDHERRVRTLLRSAGLDVAYSLSSDVLPEIREYERTLTTALNAALKPVMAGYLGALESRVRDRGVGADLGVIQSNGGLITADAARERPVNTLLSGPAAGVQGATYVAKRRGVSDVITMDMGGTSCDVSLVEGGDPLVSTDVEVGDYAVGVPMIDVHTVGSGGGSIAWVDEGGALRVGPRSAGADPGPVSYGRGGTEPTTTDAHLLLGRLDPDRFLAEELDGAVTDVRDAFDDRLGDALGMEPREAAQGVLDVANANMRRALRVVSVERGYDPREFALVAFGGAGPLHGPRLAADLDIPTVIVPRTAGVLSALGLLVSDVAYDDGVSRVRRWDEVSPATFRRAFADLRERGEQRLQADGIAPADRRYDRTAALRYAGQSFEVPVAVPDGEIDEGSLDVLVDRFHAEHERRYGHADRSEPVELVTLRLRARGVVDTPDLPTPTTEGTIDDAIREVRSVVYDGDHRETRVYERGALPAGATFDGPAVVEGTESTVVVHPGQTAAVDRDGNIVVDTGGGR